MTELIYRFKDTKNDYGSDICIDYILINFADDKMTIEMKSKYMIIESVASKSQIFKEVFNDGIEFVNTFIEFLNSEGQGAEMVQVYRVTSTPSRIVMYNSPKVFIDFVDKE